MRRILAGLFAGLVLAGCASEGEPGLLPAESLPDVDTPELRTMKQDAGIEPCVPGSAEPVDGGLPKARLPCLGGGRSVELSSLRGPLVINAWASWCGPCRRELPIYQEFAEKYAGRVGVLGVDWDDKQPEAALELLRDSGVTYPQLADQEPVIASRGLPRLIVVDEGGEMVVSRAVEVRSLAELEALVLAPLGVGS